MCARDVSSADDFFKSRVYLSLMGADAQNVAEVSRRLPVHLSLHARAHLHRPVCMYVRMNRSLCVLARARACMLIGDWGQWHFDGFDQVILAAFVGDTADPVRSAESLKRFEIAPPTLDGAHAGGVSGWAAAPDARDVVHADLRGGDVLYLPAGCALPLSSAC